MDVNEHTEWPFTKDKVGYLAATQYLTEAGATLPAGTLFDVIEYANGHFNKHKGK